jgi:hypothetical protein
VPIWLDVEGVDECHHSVPINYIWMMKVYQILDQWRLVILRAASESTSLFFVPPYNLFVFGIPYPTLHLFVIKIKCCVDQLKPPHKADGQIGVMIGR